MRPSRKSRYRSGLRAVALVVLALGALLVPLHGGAQAIHEETKEQLGIDGIGPGSPILVTLGGLLTENCTANFIWKDTSNQKYLGTAGHCLENATRVEVCWKNCVLGAFTNWVHDFVPPGLVELCGSATTSCSDMIPVRSKGQGSDFGLIRLSHAPSGSLRPEMPIFDGPSGSDSTVGLGEPLCMYGAGLGVGETTATKGRALVGVSTSGGTWHAHGVASKGDSGAPVVNCLNGKAVGLQTHIACLPGITCGTTVSQAESIGGVSIWEG